MSFEMIPFLLGNQYFTQDGELVRFVAVHHEGTSYETMEDEEGVNRYTRRDFGRVTGTDHNYSDSRNTPPLFKRSDVDVEVEAAGEVVGCYRDVGGPAVNIIWKAGEPPEIGTKLFIEASP